MAGFCVVFCVFFDLGVLELRVEKKKAPKKCARDTGGALLRPACPSPAPLRPSLGAPVRVSLAGLFRRKLSVSKIYLQAVSLQYKNSPVLLFAPQMGVNEHFATCCRQACRLKGTSLPPRTATTALWGSVTASKGTPQGR